MTRFAEPTEDQPNPTPTETTTMATKITRLPARVLVPLGSLGTDEWFMHDGQLYRIYAVNEETGEITVFAHDKDNFYQDVMSPDTEVEPQDVEIVVRPRVAGD